jgi:hypothetical protein
VTKFLFDGFIFLSIIQTILQFTHDKDSSFALDCLFLILTPIYVILFRPNIQKDENRYDSGRYMVSDIRVNYFLRYIILFGLFLNRFHLNLITLENIIGILCFYLWATRPMPPTSKTSFAFNGV